MRSEKMNETSEAFLRMLADTDASELMKRRETTALAQALSDSISAAVCPMQEWEIPFIIYALELALTELRRIFPEAVSAAEDLHKIFSYLSYTASYKHKKPPMDLAEPTDGKGED